MNNVEQEKELLRLEEKWSHVLDQRGVSNIADRLILADIFEAKGVPINYRVAHFYGKTPPIDGAVLVEGTEDQYCISLNTNQLNKFIEENGPVQIFPPSQSPCKGEWCIWVTDGGSFKQR